MAKRISNTVDGAIKRCYAKLAQKHFEKARDSIGSCSDTHALNNKGIIESSERMLIVEGYLQRAGADATRYHFND